MWNHSSGCWDGRGQAAAGPGAQWTHIWSQGSWCSGASRSGLGSLTKMSPLQVTDQMACREGRPRTLRLSQQDRLSRASWRGQAAGHWDRDRQRAKAGLPLVCCPLTLACGDHRPLTQSFMSCSVAAARRTGHLCRVLSGVYRAKECLASLSTGTRVVTSLRNTCRYCDRRRVARLSAGRDRDGLGYPSFQRRSLGPWPAGLSGGSGSPSGKPSSGANAGLLLS